MSAHRIWKGALAGFIGGLGGAWAMNLFQALGSKIGAGDARSPFSDDNATANVARAIARRVLQRDLTNTELRSAAPIVHYGFGAAMGTLYGAAAEFAPAVGLGEGAGFGAALWIAADEISLPALGLSRAPRAYPPSTHVSAAAAHLVYGVSTDLIRRAVRSTHRP